MFALRDMIDRGLRCERENPQMVYFAPTYGQAKRVAWDYMKQFTRDIPGVRFNEAELKVRIPRPQGDEVRFFLMGAENPDAIRGLYLDWGVLDEFAEMHPRTWSQVIRPALADRLGGATFIGTPKGQNTFFDMYMAALDSMDWDDEWFASLFRASETGIIPDSELRAAQKSMPKEEYEQEFECSFEAALLGAYYGDELSKLEKAGRIGDVSWDPAVPVQTAWDLGLDDHTAIWFIQEVGSEIHVVNYYENRNKGLDHYVRVIKSFEEDLGYYYGTHYLPHDAGARELGTKKTREETLKGLKLGRTKVNSRQSVEDGIHATRMMLPRCWFDYRNCKMGILALKNYEREWDAKEKVFKQTPKHNWASHGADAFRSFSMGQKRRVSQGRRPTTCQMDFDIFGG